MAGFISENGYLILFICSVLYYCSPVLNLISVMQNKEKRKSFPAFFLIFGALNSFYWIVYGLLLKIDDTINLQRQKEMYLMQGILGSMLLSLWLILYIINTSSSKCSSIIHIIIFFIFCITALIIIFNWVQNNTLLNIIYLCLNILMFSTSSLPILFGDGWVHTNIPISIPFIGVFFSLTWFIYYLIYDIKKMWNLINWGICIFLNIVQVCLYFTLLCKKNQDEQPKDNIITNSMNQSLKNNESKNEEEENSN